MYNNSAKFRGFKSWTKRSLAFTLAEILITIVTIGIVAALTVPTTIQKYQRLYTETQLKVIYNLLNRALESAEMQYGPRTTWNLADYNSDKYKNIDPTAEIINKYFVPYLKLKQPYGKSMTFSSLGYKNGTKYADGSIFVGPVDITTPLILQNGIIIMPYTDYVKTKTGNYIPYVLALNVDVNGSKQPNVFNKDIFRFEMIFINKEPFVLGWVWGTNTDEMTGKQSVIQYRQIDELRNYCLNSAPVYNSDYCAAWIMMNGFKIPDDYPLL